MTDQNLKRLGGEAPMPWLLRLILSAGRKRRSLVACATLWVLRLLRDIESDEMDRHSDLLDKFDLSPEFACRRKYTAVEDDYSECEFTLAFLDSAIDELESAYWRF
jgi:hypothetical protein